MPELSVTTSLMHDIPTIICQYFEYSTSFYYFHGSIYIFCLHRKNSKNTTIKSMGTKKDINKIINRTASSEVQANKLTQFEILRAKRAECTQS